MVIISYPCRGWLVPSPHFRPCSDQISSPSLPPCALENSEYFCLNYNRCCREKPFPILLHHTYKLSFRDKVNLKLCIPSGQKWLLLNLYVKICNNLSITKRCYRHPGAQWSSHMPQWMCAYRCTCTCLHRHIPAQPSTASCLHSCPPFPFVSTACKYTRAS